MVHGPRCDAQGTAVDEADYTPGTDRGSVGGLTGSHAESSSGGARAPVRSVRRDLRVALIAVLGALFVILLAVAIGLSQQTEDFPRPPPAPTSSQPDQANEEAAP